MEKSLGDDTKSRGKNYSFHIVIVLTLALGLITAVVLSKSSQDIRSNAATPSIERTALITGFPEVASRRILVKFRTGSEQKSFGGKLTTQNLSVKESNKVFHASVVTVPADKKISDVVASLKSDPSIVYALEDSDPSIVYALEDKVQHVLGIPNDPQYGIQWQLPAVNAPPSWDISTGMNIVVADIDTGLTLLTLSLRQIWCPGGIS